MRGCGERAVAAAPRSRLRRGGWRGGCSVTLGARPRSTRPVVWSRSGVDLFQGESWAAGIVTIDRPVGLPVQ